MKFPNLFTKHGGCAASQFAFVALVMALLAVLAGGLHLRAESREIQGCSAKAATLVKGAGELCRLRGEIDDPNTGTRWLLVRDSIHSGGPGRLEPVSPTRDPGALGKKANAVGIASTTSPSIVRAGDKVVVEEHSATTDAYLEGVALAPGGPGTILHVRLLIGGRVVRAVAVASGRVALEVSSEAGR
jgi:hypothetical protein